VHALRVLASNLHLPFPPFSFQIGLPALGLARSQYFTRRTRRSRCVAQRVQVRQKDLTTLVRLVSSQRGNILRARDLHDEPSTARSSGPEPSPFKVGPGVCPAPRSSSGAAWKRKVVCNGNLTRAEHSQVSPYMTALMHFGTIRLSYR
jgi:hypothetical protein